jgi:hypothetical protein
MAPPLTDTELYAELLDALQRIAHALESMLAIMVETNPDNQPPGFLSERMKES